MSSAAELSARVADALHSVGPAARADAARIRVRLDGLAKPPGSLGALEEIALRIACITGDPPPQLRRRRVLVFAADHGVTAQGVSAYPRTVTRNMCALIAAGRAAVNVLAHGVGADVTVIDVGVDAAEPIPGTLCRRVRRGTRDLSAGAALTRDEADAAFLVGYESALQAAGTADIIALGEMGIGNTTAAAALTAALTGAAIGRVVGPGTGIDGGALERKRAIVASAVLRIRHPHDARAVLTEVGGLEIAALAGATIGAAAANRPVVTDGFIATAGVLAAVRLCPAARDYVFASHLSAEPGHAVQLEALGLRPVVRLDLRLGEGTGAVLVLPILDAAAAILRDMATLEEALAVAGTAKPAALSSP